MIDVDILINGISYKDYLVYFRGDIGKSNATPLEGVSPGGSCTLKLLADAPIYGWFNYMNPQASDTTIQFLAEGNILWTGRLYNIAPTDIITEYPTMTITGVDSIGYLRTRNFDTFRTETSVRYTGDLIRDMLRSAGWDVVNRARIDRGQSRVKGPTLIQQNVLGTTLRPTNVMTIVEQLSKAEPGFIFNDREGVIIFEDRNKRTERRATEPIVIFSDEPDGESSYSHILPNMNYRDNVYNRFRAQITTERVRNVERLIRNFNRVRLHPGETLTYQKQAPFKNDAGEVFPFVNGFSPAVYQFVNADGSDANSSVTVSNERLTNPVLWQATFTNNSPRTIYLVGLEVSGAGVLSSDDDNIDIIADDPLSIERYDLKEYQVPTMILDNPNDYNAYVKYLLRIYNKPIYTANVIVPMSDISIFNEAIKPSVGDLVELKSQYIHDEFLSTTPRKFFIEAEEWNYYQNGHLTVKYSVSDATRLYPFATFGASRFGEGIAMGF